MAELKKSLGVTRGTAMMLNIVLGAGLLTLPGLAVQEVGSSATLIWIACAVAAAPLLWVFAILGRRYPDAGGIASIMGHAFGKSGRICATLLFLGAVSVGLPAVALTGGHYVAATFGGPAAVYAGALIVAALGVNFLSAEMAGRVNTFIASLVLVFILGLAIVGYLAVQPAFDLSAASTPSADTDLRHLGMVFMMVFFAFTGWEVSANLGGEFRNPKRDVPRAMALSFFLAVGLYLVLALVVAKAGALGAGPAPFAQIFGQSFGPAGRITIAALAVLLIFANLSAAIWAVSRMVYSAARDGLLPAPIAQIRNDVPLNAVMVTVVVLLSVVGLVGAGILDMSHLLAAAGQNFLLLYTGAAASLLRLERRTAYRLLSLGCLALVCLLFIGRGGQGLLYPVLLIALGLAISFLQKGDAALRNQSPAE
ncbi:amino acid permease (plasmid) [Thioclava litoralis]|uniref:Amino acid permease n=1 Tax=Thioclava litoralis TaxID=3076557 RepID=A0ABZ1E2Y6_9RHOB|nr:amino acid permease [Thioclava sp. FTW29]